MSQLLVDLISQLLVDQKAIITPFVDVSLPLLLRDRALINKGAGNCMVAILVIILI